MRTLEVSETTSGAMATDTTELDFEAEHQKQLARLALFDNVILLKKELKTTVTELEQKRQEVEELETESGYHLVVCEALSFGRSGSKDRLFDLKKKINQEKAFIETVISQGTEESDTTLRSLILHTGGSKEFSDVKASLGLAKESVAQAFEAQIDLLQYTVELDEAIRKRDTLSEMLESNQVAIQELECAYQQILTKCQNAEQEWRRVYGKSSEESKISDKNFEIGQLQDTIQMRENKIEAQTKRIAGLELIIEEAEEDRERFWPLVIHGANIRSRMLESLKPKVSQSIATLEAGNRSAHQGSAVADALLYLPECPGHRTDPEHFNFMYGFGPETVRKRQNLEQCIQILDWRGGFQDFCKHKATVFKDTTFNKLLKSLFMLVGRGLALDVLEELLAEDDTAKTIFEEMRKEFDSGLAAHKVSLKNRRSNS